MILLNTKLHYRIDLYHLLKTLTSPRPISPKFLQCFYLYRSSLYCAVVGKSLLFLFYQFSLAMSGLWCMCECDVMLYLPLSEKGYASNDSLVHIHTTASK